MSHQPAASGHVDTKVSPVVRRHSNRRFGGWHAAQPICVLLLALFMSTGGVADALSGAPSDGKPEDWIKLPNDLKTTQDIKISKEYLDSLAKEVDQKVSALGANDLFSQADQIRNRIGQLREEHNPDNDAEMTALREKHKVIQSEAERIFDEGYALRGHYDFDKYRNKILLAESVIRDQAVKEAQAKKVAEFREKANLNEEEYFVPLFECSVQGAYWCFSSSHKIYAVTGKVTIRDDSKEMAAVYQEVGQGEAEDYYKDKSGAAAELFMGRDTAFSNAVTERIVSEQKIWVSGIGQMPHVYMAKERR
jgi:hypothetical protein